jgi:hypothetical protein
VFIYDTSKDSDGGAWRKRCSNLSWYNETLNTAARGLTKEFPSIALIVAETTKVTIYDATDPNAPMWRVHDFIGYVIKSVSVLNTKLVVATTTNAIAFDYIAEVTTVYTNSSTPAIVNNSCNDVAMTVLSGATIDGTTGIAVPTIACLVGESLVTMSDGSLKRIDQVEVGDTVKTFEGNHTVLNWFDQGIKDVIELEFDGGETLVCTPDHRIKTTEGWVEAGLLTEDMEVVSL